MALCPRLDLYSIQRGTFDHIFREMGYHFHLHCPDILYHANSHHPSIIAVVFLQTSSLDSYQRSSSY